jgi:hypothetical protein
VWHPVGELPAAVYWRRRVLVLTVLLAVLAGLGWLGWFGYTQLSGQAGTDDAASDTPVRTPALEQVVPSLAAVAMPTPPSLPPATAVAAPAVLPLPVAGGPCTDEMIGLEVRAPASVPIASKPTFELLVTNASVVPCVRALDKGLQEIQLFDLAGTRIWGSNDCFPEASSEPRTLAPGEVVSIPLVWGGLSSEPTCTAARANPGPGNYVLVGRLDTKVSPNAPLVLG